MIIPVTGHSPTFSGDTHIGSATVSIRHEDSLGTGQIHVHPGGTFLLSPLQGTFENSRLDLPNAVHLDGGEISGGPSSFRRQRLLGELHVAGYSAIGQLEVVGDMHLSNGSQLATTSHVETRFLGDMYVGGNTTIQIGGNLIRATDFGGQRGRVEFGGTIISDSTVARLNIHNAGLDEFVFNSSLHVQDGQSLEILLDGAAMELSFNGSEITGSGTFLNPVAIQDGAVVSPGNSPGKLTFENTLTIGPNAVYRWEISDPQGAPGMDWDLVQVNGLVQFAATPGDPFEIQIHELGGAIGPVGRWLILSSHEIAGFDPEAFQITVHANIGRLSPNASHWSVEHQDGDIYLAYQVPEPTMQIYLASWISALAFCRSRRQRHREA
jgi:hypothetical protein